MASIRKARGKWLAEVCIKGHRESKTFAIKHDAQAWALEVERSRGLHKHVPTGYTLGDAMERYGREISVTKRGRRWEEVRLRKLGRDRLAYITLERLRRDDMQEWINRQTVGAGSVRRELNLLRSVLKYARVHWKWMSHEVMKDLLIPAAPPHRDRRISDGEIAGIGGKLGFVEGMPIKQASHELAVAFLFALETAMRQGEIWGMDWQHVNLTDRFVTLPMTKNGSKRDVPLSSRAVELLEMLPGERAGRVFKSSQTRAGLMFREAVRDAGISDLRFHDARHCAIIRLARKLDVLDLARMVGHKDLKSLMIYYHPTAADIAKRLG